jgi:hypothetical protein
MKFSIDVQQCIINIIEMQMQSSRIKRGERRKLNGDNYGSEPHVHFYSSFLLHKSRVNSFFFFFFIFSRVVINFNFYEEYVFKLEISFFCRRLCVRSEIFQFFVVLKNYFLVVPPNESVDLKQYREGKVIKSDKKH